MAKNTSETRFAPSMNSIVDKTWQCTIKNERGGIVGRGESHNKEEAEERAAEDAAENEEQDDDEDED